MPRPAIAAQRIPHRVLEDFEQPTWSAFGRWGHHAAQACSVLQDAWLRRGPIGYIPFHWREVLQVGRPLVCHPCLGVSMSGKHEFLWGVRHLPEILGEDRSVDQAKSLGRAWTSASADELGLKGRSPIRLWQRGNVANNGFHNRRILRHYTFLECDPVASEVRHAMSLPAWDELDFDPFLLNSVHDPNWTRVPGAWPLNQAEIAGSVRRPTPLADRARTQAKRIGRLLLTPDQSWQLLYQRAYGHRSLRILYGAIPRSTSLIEILRRILNILSRALHPVKQRLLMRKGPGTSPDLLLVLGDSGPVVSSLRGATIALEHGTLRWASSTSRESGFRARFLEQISLSDHLWVTNLDPASIETAEKEMPGKWSAFPHPYFLDSLAPYAADVSTREAFLGLTQSRYLLVLPASINWTGDHNKGSARALEAFRQLRGEGLECGLLAMGWGADLTLAQEWLQDHQVARYVHWINPLPRIGLQRLMAICDVVLDQFGLEAFGALMLRALEQGVPVVSRGLTIEAEQLIGREVPWLPAVEPMQIVERVQEVLMIENPNARSELRFMLGTRGRKWLYERHHHEITAILQIRRYATLLGLADFGPAKPGDWAAIPDHGTQEWQNFLSQTLATGEVHRLSDESVW